VGPEVQTVPAGLRSIAELCAGIIQKLLIVTGKITNHSQDIFQDKTEDKPVPFGDIPTIDQDHGL
jgi:hypothetical protein